MRAKGGSSYSGPMDSSRLPERAALVALLQARPGGMSWAEITADVLEVGSALELWHRTVPAVLMAAMALFSFGAGGFRLAP